MPHIIRLSLSFPLILGVLLLILSFWLKQKIEYGYQQQSKQKSHTLEKYVNKFQATRLNEQGQIEYTLEADRMFRYEDEDWHYMDKPRFTYFSPTEYTVINSVQAKTDDFRQKVEMLDRVTLFSERANSQSISVIANNLVVYPNAKRIISNEKLQGKLGESTILANGIFVDQNSGKILLNGRVSGEYLIGTK